MLSVLMSPTGRKVPFSSVHPTEAGLLEFLKIYPIITNEANGVERSRFFVYGCSLTANSFSCFQEVKKDEGITFPD